MNKFRDVKVHSKDVMVKSTYVTKNARDMKGTISYVMMNATYMYDENIHS